MAQTEGITFYFEGNTVEFDRSVDGVKKALSLLKAETKAWKEEFKKTGNISALKQQLNSLSQEQKAAKLSVRLWADEVTRLANIGKKRSKEEEKEYKNAIKQWADAKKRLTSIQIEFKKNVDLLKEMSGPSKEFAEHMEEAGKAAKEIDALKRKVELLNNALKINPKSFSLLYVKIQNIKKQQEKANELLKKYKDILGELERNGLKGTDKWDQTNDAIHKTEKDLGNLNLQLKDAEDSMGKLEEFATSGSDAFTDLGNAFKNAGENLQNFSSAVKPFSDFATKVLKQAADNAIEFEDAFAEVKKTVEETDTTSYEDLAISAKEMSKNLPMSADEIAKLMGLAGQMGVSADNVAYFTEKMIEFGYSTNITAEQAAEEIAQIYNVIGKTGNFDTLDNLLSTIVELGNNTATTEADITTMMKNIASSASRVGMNEQQMAALAATLSSLGLDKGGASAVSTILQKIDLAVDTNADSVEDWADATGLSVAEFKKAWNTDASATFVAMIDNMRKTVDEGGSLNEIFDDLGISELRRVDTMGRLVNGQELYNNTLAIANQAFEESVALEEEATKRMATLKSRIQILKNNFQIFATTIGELLFPYIEKLLEILMGVADYLNNMSPATQDLIVKTLGIMAALSPLTKILGIVSTFIGNFIISIPRIVSIIRTVVSIVTKLGTVLKTMFSVIATFAEAHPVIATLTILIGVIIVLYQKFEWFRDIVKDVLEFFKGLWAKFAEVNWIEVLSEKFNIFGTILGTVFELVKALVEGFGKLIDKVKSFLGLQSQVDTSLPSSLAASRLDLSDGGFRSGGFMSGGMTINNSFTINGVEQLSNARLLQVADVITDRVNENLGRMV